MTEKNKKIKKGNSKRMFSWMNSDLEVRETGKYGKGVFAKKDIKKGELLAIFGGYIFRIDETVDELVGDYSLQIDEKFVIGSNFKEDIDIDLTNFFNHNCNPNSGFKGQIFLVSMKKINSNSEITFDYSMVLHKAIGVDKYILKCSCNSKKCRKIITEDDWKIKELQKKYNGYFQWFLQEKINKLIK
jgi:uncharacterized protein